MTVGKVMLDTSVNHLIDTEHDPFQAMLSP